MDYLTLLAAQAALDQTEAPRQVETRAVAVPEPTEEAMQYYRSGNVIWAVDVLGGIVVLALFLFTGMSARIRDWATKAGRKWFFIIGVYVIVFAAMIYVLRLPWAYCTGFLRGHAYGLSNQTIDKWLSDYLRNFALIAATGVLFLWIPYLLLRKSPRRWWLYSSMLAVPFILFQMLITPIWIDPLFNDFGSMKDKGLEAEILALADRAGIEDGRVYEVDKSVDTKTVNAYVTGFLDTKRIVLWDTIIEKLDEDELLFVMGHEMGHYALRHVVRNVFVYAVLILAALYLIHRTADGLIRRHKDRFGFERLSDIASLPLIILLINIFALALNPVMLGYTRYNEREADRFGLEIRQDNRAAANAFVKLQHENLANPRPGMPHKLWRANHPPIGERVDFCNDYRPWETGERLKYGHLSGGSGTEPGQATAP